MRNAKDTEESWNETTMATVTPTQESGTAKRTRMRKTRLEQLQTMNLQDIAKWLHVYEDGLSLNAFLQNTLGVGIDPALYMLGVENRGKVLSVSDRENLNSFFSGTSNYLRKSAELTLTPEWTAKLAKLRAQVDLLQTQLTDEG